MTYEELHDRVGQLIAEEVWNCGNDCISHGDDANAAATVAIRTVIEALAQEAEAILEAGEAPVHLAPLLMDGDKIADWLRSHIPEATDDPTP